MQSLTVAAKVMHERLGRLAKWTIDVPGGVDPREEGMAWASVRGG